MNNLSVKKWNLEKIPQSDLDVILGQLHAIRKLIMNRWRKTDKQNWICPIVLNLLAYIPFYKNV